MGLEDLPELGDTSGFCHYGDKPYYKYMDKDNPCYVEIAEITFNHLTPAQKIQTNSSGYSLKVICYVFGKYDNLPMSGESRSPVKCLLVTDELWPSNKCAFSWENGGPYSVAIECIEEYHTVKKFKRKDK